MKLSRRIGFALMMSGLVLAGGEVALRAAGWPKMPSADQFTHNDVYWVQDPSQRLEAKSHKETGGSFRVSTDANGLRAPLHGEEKPAGTTRVMTLGCSTTFGWGVDDDASYPARLEAILREEGHPVEVINGGQPGYTSFQGLWLWERTLKNYHPDIVIFGYIVQDSRTVAYSDKSQAMLQQNADFLKVNLLYHSRLYMGLRALIDARRISTKEKPTDGGSYRVPPDEYAANIRQFKENIEAAGAKMVFFGFPLEREGYTGVHRAILHSAAKKLDVPIYDPQPDFEVRTAQETLYFPQDRGHANAAGNDAIAQGMAQFLVANRLVP